MKILSLPSSLLTSVLVLAMSTSPASAERSYVWDLSDMIADHHAWEAERDWVLDRTRTIDELAGSASRGPSSLADVLDAVYELRSRATRLAIYGFLSSDEDTTSERGRLYYEVGTALEHQALGSTAFVKRDVLDLGAERLARWSKSEPRLIRHSGWIADMLRMGPYTLPAQAEAVVESAARWPRLPADVFGPLNSAPVGWKRVRMLDGEEVTANRSAYQSRRSTPVRADRLNISRAYFNHAIELEDIFGLLYTRRIEADLALARQRGFDDAMEALWFTRDGMPAQSHRPMIEVTRKNLEALRRYVSLRSQILGIEDPTLVDLYAPLPGLPTGISIPTAVDTALSALAPLGPEFDSTARAIVKEPWMHLESTPNKGRSYAIWPPVAGSPPYFFQAYDGTLNGSRAVAGGLALQGAFASIPDERTPATRDDPGIYANGMIYVGDMLHDDLVTARARNREERIAMLVHSLDFLWRHFIRWVLVTELDAEVQALILAGENPSGSQVTDIYGRLQQDYYSPSGTTLALEPNQAAEWMSFSVPFLSFEHQFWPPAVALAAAIVERISAGDSATAERSWQLLGRGEVDRSYQLAGSIGIDMASVEPYQAVFRRMNSLLDKLASELEERPGAAGAP